MNKQKHNKQKHSTYKLYKQVQRKIFTVPTNKKEKSQYVLTIAQKW